MEEKKKLRFGRFVAFLTRILKLRTQVLLKHRGDKRKRGNGENNRENKGNKVVYRADEKPKDWHILAMQER
jgi:hypothetical protein